MNDTLDKKTIGRAVGKGKLYTVWPAHDDHQGRDVLAGDRVVSPSVTLSPSGLGVSWLVRESPSRGPISRLRIRVDVPADSDLSPEHTIKLALGIVCERMPAGVKLGWGVPSRDTAPVFGSFAECEAWLLERCAGMQTIARELAGTATGLYHADRAAFLSCCVTILRVHAHRLWS